MRKKLVYRYEDGIKLYPEKKDYSIQIWIIFWPVQMKFYNPEITVEQQDN